MTRLVKGEWTTNGVKWFTGTTRYEAEELQVKSKYIIPVSDTGLTHSSNFVYRILNLPFTEFHDV